MVLMAAVGRNAANRRADVKAVQALLNLNGASPVLDFDGLIGAGTRRAIDRFQHETMGTELAVRRGRAGQPDA